MWISREKLRKLEKQVEDLERRQLKHGTFLHNDYEKLQSLMELKKAVGKKRGNSMWDRYFMRSMWDYDYPTKTEPKELTLIEEVEQIKELLGIEEKLSRAERKLVIKPKKVDTEAKKKASAKKAKK